MNLRSPATWYDPVDVQRRLAEILSPVPDRMNAAVVWYSQEAPRWGLRWDFALAQAVHETDYSRSQVCTERRNWAGIKIPAGQPGAFGYRIYPTDRDGISDHCQHLARYTGLWIPDSVDPTRNTRIPQILATRLGRPYIVDSAELNGIWAVPGTEYAQNIERTRRRLFGDSDG